MIWKTVIQLNLIGCAPFLISKLRPFNLTVIHSSIKMLLEILQEEWESVAVVKASQPNNNLRRIRLGLSPLLFIETNLMQLISPGNRNSRDICVRTGGDWKATLMARAPSPVPSSPIDGKRSSHNNHGNKQIDPTSVLAASKDDIVVLWTDPSVRDVLSKRGIKMEDMSGLSVAFDSHISSFLTLIPQFPERH